MLFSMIGCGKVEGEFAFKYLLDSDYRRIRGIPEFNGSREVRWIYLFNNIRGYHKIGVVIMKKELVWVDIDTRIDNINEANDTIYGVIKDYKEGRHAILITENGRIIDRKEFDIYSDEED